MKMRTRDGRWSGTLWAAPILTAALLTGCSGEVQTTEDAVHVEADVPKVEVGEADVDLNPETDDDIDIDTPAPGDN